MERKQLRINSWGKKYILEAQLNNTLEYNQMLELISKIYLQHKEKYDELKRLLTDENIDTKSITEINNELSIKLLS